MRQALAALTYADRRIAVNRWRALRRAPWRLATWAAWLALMIGLGWLRTHQNGGAQIGGYRDWWAAFALIVAGSTLMFGGRRAAGFFASHAEAAFLVRAALPPLLVVGYVQARSLLSFALQMFSRFSYVLLLTLPGRATAAGLVLELALFFCGLLTVRALGMPRTLARGPWRTLLIAAGALLTAAAILPFVPQGRLPVWHPGTVLAAVERGDARPLLVLLALAALACAVFVAGARDVYPELYAASLAQLEQRPRARARMPSRRRAVSATLRLRGVPALIWVDALQWRRRSSGPVLLLVALGCLAAGAALPLVLPHARSAPVVYVMLPSLYVPLTATTALRLAADLRRPLFWLGAAPLRARLSAWGLAPLWRDLGALALFAAGYGLAVRDARAPVLLVCEGLVLAPLMRAAGVAMFALFPNTLDQRGPAIVLRALCTYAALLPAGVVFGVTAFAFANLPAGVAATLITSAIEAALLIAFAAWRLDGRVDRLADA